MTGEPEFRPPRVLRDVTLQYLSLDLYPGPYGSVPRAVHRLKTWPLSFDFVKSGDKMFEVRRDDRGFRPGDRVILVRFDPAATFQASEELEFEISCVLAGAPGIEPGYAVLGLRPVPDREDSP